MSAGIEVNGTEVVITVAGESRRFKVEHAALNESQRPVQMVGTQATNLDWYACAFDALIRYAVDQEDLRQDSINHQFLGEY